MASAKPNQKKVLFYTRGPAATEEEKKAAAEIEGNVVFRNGSGVSPTDRLEPCDFVAGYATMRYEGVAKFIGPKGDRPHGKEPKAEEPKKGKGKGKPKPEDDDIL